MLVERFFTRLFVFSQWLKSARELRDFIKRSGMYVSQSFLKTHAAELSLQHFAASAFSSPLHMCFLVAFAFVVYRS
jgi:hypothetical protein